MNTRVLESNPSGKGRVEFTGFDLQFSACCKGRLSRFRILTIRRNGLRDRDKGYGLKSPRHLLGIQVPQHTVCHGGSDAIILLAKYLPHNADDFFRLARFHPECSLRKLVFPKA